MQDYHLEESEKRFLLSMDKMTLESYIYGFDDRVNKTQWLWYYMKSISGGAIHVIPNVCYAGISIHQFMISDMLRNKSFEKAIFKIINDLDIVADAGAGTGILSFLAVKAGAGKVYAIEKDRRLIQITKELCYANKLQDKVFLIQGDIQNVMLPEKVDVIISECLGSFGVNSHLLPALLDFRRNNLRPSGKVIPYKIKLYIAPYETILYDLFVRFWEDKILDIDFKSLMKYVENQVFVIIGEENGVLADSSLLFEVDLLRDSEVRSVSNIEFEIRRRGILHGFIGWFEAMLHPNIILTTSPSAPRTHWYQVFFPLQNKMKVAEKEKVEVNFNAEITTKGIRWRWQTYLPLKGITFCQDTNLSYPNRKLPCSMNEGGAKT